jgi:sulfonate transport system ATP-binding protein
VVAGEIGFVFQEPRLFPWLTVEGNVRFAARNPREHARIGEVLALVGLGAARAKLPKELSGGMAQRAALARTLVRAPDVILLDEPLAALDALRRLELRAALREIVTAAGATAILVTHDVDEALDFGTRQLVLERAADGVRSREPLADGTDAEPRLALLWALGVARNGA